MPEDRAYCLLGLLGIYMEPRYGEVETRAFERLYETVEQSELGGFGISSLHYSNLARSGGPQSRYHEEYEDFDEDEEEEEGDDYHVSDDEWY